MAARDTVRIFITGDTTGFKKAVGEVESTGKRLSGLAKTALAGATAAAGAAAVKAIGNYSKLADEVRNFKTVTGLSAEQSSRAIEAFGDLGVESTSLQTAFAKMNKNIGTSDKAFKKWGVSIVRAKDGTVDTNQTFANAIQVLAKLQDATERNKAANDLFGRSWQDLAPAIAVADQLQQRIASVGSGQIITDDELARQQRFKDSLDNLKDKAAGLANDFSEIAIPVLSAFFDVVDKIPTPVLTTAAGIAALATAVSKLSGAMAVFSANPMLIALGLVIGALVLLIQHAKEAQDVLGGLFYGPAKFVNNLFGGNLGKGQLKLGPAGEAYVAGKRAMGGPVGAGMPYLVGERGPEVFVPRVSGTIVPNGGGTIVQYVTVQASNPYELNRALERDARAAQRAAGR